jgi:hypothetical protein
VDNDLRASLAAAGAAAALSALIGIIAGVGFFVLLLRAIACALVVGAAVYGGILLVRRALPGLLSPEADEGGQLEDGSTGTKVDIVLPEETASADYFGGGEGAAWPSEGALPSEAPRPDRTAKRREQPPSAAKQDLSPLDVTSLLEPEEAEEVEPVLPAASSPGKERHPSPAFDDLDVLPDLDGFSDTFAASEFTSGALQAEAPARAQSAASASGPSLGGRSGPHSGQDGLDPASLAKAVRTILKRDQKG